MSNHSYVILRDGLPAVPQFEWHVNHIISRKFPQFKLVRWDNCAPEVGWELTHEPTGVVLMFWMSKCGDPDTFNPDTGEFVKQVPCLEFRHSSVLGGLMWWIEYEIREELAVRYGGVTMDDSEAEVNAPQTERFATYADYLDHTGQLTGPSVTWVKILIAGTPKDLMPLVGDLDKNTRKPT